MEKEFKENEESIVKYLTFEQMMVENEKRPKERYLISGVKEKTFGLVFGPSKSGKTIFCENLGMSIAMGANSFMDYKLNGVPDKVLFVGLEEYYTNRAERNKKQFDILTDEQKELVNKNFRYQPIEFSKRVVTDKHWESLIETIVASEAKVVFIDSITRMNPGKLEDSKNAEIIMQKLRNICYDLDITLFCIHHTPKMYESLITMDSIKGSAVFAQESDFAIGINKTSKGLRYQKNVFFRYAPDNDETVKEFEIDDSIWLNYLEDADETELISRTDRRRNDDTRNLIIGYLDKNSSTTFKTKNLVNFITSTTSVKERMVKNYLSELSSNGKINGSTHGVYCSVNYVEANKG